MVCFGASRGESLDRKGSDVFDPFAVRMGETTVDTTVLLDDLVLWIMKR